MIDHNKKVLIETNGSLNIDNINPPAVRIVDIKCPGSGESGKIRWENLNLLRKEDEIKFVVTDRHDFDWAIDIINTHHLFSIAHILFSPVYQKMEPTTLAQWILTSNLPIRLQIQLQKYIALK